MSHAPTRPYGPVVPDSSQPACNPRGCGLPRRRCRPSYRKPTPYMTNHPRRRVAAVAVATAAALSLSMAPIAFGQGSEPLQSSLTPPGSTVEHHPAFPDIVTLRVADQAAVDR